MRFGKRHIFVIWQIVMLGLALCGQAQAQLSSLPILGGLALKPGPKSLEVWLSGHYISQSPSLSMGLTWAPFGALNRDGLRLRATLGGNFYRYRTEVYRASRLPEGGSMLSELQVGYQISHGPLTLKGFIGAAFADYALTVNDRRNPKRGLERGVAGHFDAWLNITPRTWAQFSAYATNAHRNRRAHVRLGFRLVPAFSVGLEAGVFNDASGRYLHGGPLIRYQWSAGEAVLSLGQTHAQARTPTPFASLTLVSKF